MRGVWQQESSQSSGNALKMLPGLQVRSVGIKGGAAAFGDMFDLFEWQVEKVTFFEIPQS